MQRSCAAASDEQRGEGSGGGSRGRQHGARARVAHPGDAARAHVPRSRAPSRVGLRLPRPGLERPSVRRMRVLLLHFSACIRQIGPQAKSDVHVNLYPNDSV